jgi:hypothetical protein
MAIRTPGSIATLVGIVLGVTAITGLRQRIRDILHMTRLAPCDGVLADEGKARLRMIETLYLPASLDMARRTILAQLAGVGIVLRMTRYTRGLNALPDLGHVARGALGSGVLSFQRERRSAVIKGHGLPS